jgi:hypothetical protein
MSLEKVIKSVGRGSLAVVKTAGTVVLGIGVCMAISTGIAQIDYLMDDRYDAKTECCEENGCWFHHPVCETYTPQEDQLDPDRCVITSEGKLECCKCVDAKYDGEDDMTPFP